MAEMSSFPGARRSRSAEVSEFPEVMAQSGANLVDVGTTNRTYARDYAAAIGPNTKAILKVHRSNFAISGFVHEDPLEEIVAIGNRYNVPIVHDLGSGCLIDTSQFGVDHEADGSRIGRSRGAFDAVFRR